MVLQVVLEERVVRFFWGAVRRVALLMQKGYLSNKKTDLIQTILKK